jgi:TonB family protein
MYIEPKSNRGWSSWGASAVVHCLLIGGLIFLPGSPVAVTSAHTEVVMPLVYQPPVKPPTPLRLPRKLVQPPVKVVSLVSPAPLHLPQPVVKQFQAPVHEQPKTAVIQAPEQAKPMDASLTQVKLATPDLPSKMAPAIPVKTNVFTSSGSSPDGHVPASRLEVKTGGFGASDGSPVQSGGGKGTGAAVRMGGFGASDGGPVQSGAGKGTGAAVHTGGFGDSAGSGSSGSGSGAGKGGVVASAGFGNATVQNPAARKAETAAPAESPVEVLWKPKPVYTEEARARKLEGNVTLEVIFRATGQVEVLRVKSGLGFGLDQSARAAAEQIRFKPGKKDGVPVDRTGTVLITFELS